MQGAVHERAEDLFYRGVVPRALTDLLVLDEKDLLLHNKLFLQKKMIFLQRTEGLKSC